MKNKKTESPYTVLSHTFKGVEEFNGEVYGYKYEITFNKSLEHTGKFSGIAKGLNDYDKKEKIESVLTGFKILWYSIINLLRK